MLCKKCGSQFSPTPARLAANDRRCPACRNRQEHLKRLERPDEAAKVRARKALRRAVACGRISRRPCEVCAAPDAQAHHDNYNKPLDVRWFCSAHHEELHRRSGALRSRVRRRQPTPMSPAPRHGSYAFQFTQMDVGGCLVIPTAHKSSIQNICSYARKYGVRLTSRQVPNGVQISRIA